MKKFSIFTIFFTVLFFSCSFNKVSSSNISFSISEASVSRMCREAKTAPESLEVICKMESENDEIVQVKSGSLADKKVLIVFDDVPVGTKVVFSATVEIGDVVFGDISEKKSDARYKKLVRYEGKSEEFTVGEGENKVSLKLKPVYEDVEDVIVDITIGSKNLELKATAEYLNGDSKLIKNEDEVSFDNLNKISFVLSGEIEEGYEFSWKLNGKKQEINSSECTFDSSDFYFDENNVIFVEVKNKDGNAVDSKELNFNLKN